MVAVAALTDDPALRGSLAQLPQDDPTIALAGIVAAPIDLLDLLKSRRIDVVIAEARLAAQLMDWRSAACLVILCEQGEEARQSHTLDAEASAFLPRSASQKTLAAVIHAVANGLIVAPRNLIGAFVDAPDAARSTSSEDEEATLTPRELEVLAAMADGLSNKAIARRLAISFHTVKFHVAAILEKLGAETRTEAVMKAAQRGLVML